MNPRRAIVLSTLSLAVTTWMASTAMAQTKPTAPDGVMIVIPLAAAAGKDRNDVVKAMQSVVAVIRKQPGLLDEVLMENRNPTNKPSHVHVTRWRELKNWETVFADAEFQKAMASSSGLFTVEGAQVSTRRSSEQGAT